MFIKDLKGHSGCSISLNIENSGKRFVRKISSSNNYNNRLIDQYKKQKKFKNTKILAPEVLGSGYIEDLFYFDMEFVKGRCLHEFILRNDIDSIIKIFDDIEIFLCKESQDIVDISGHVERKIESMLDKVDIREYGKYFDYIMSSPLKSTSSTDICHGDLTFENMIVSQGNLYFIDFLDSYIDSRILDISKILQDILYFWSWRDYSKKPIVKNISLLEKIERMDLYVDNKHSINSIMILNMIRIIPYTNDKKIVQYLDNCLYHAISRDL
jgi:hypothetical protein